MPTFPDTYEGRQQEEVHLLEYWYVVLRRRKLVLGIAFAVLSLALIRGFLTRAVYQGTAQLLIERDAPSVLSFKEVAQINATQDDYYQTQYKLLQSRALARKAIEEMDLLQDPEFGGPRSPEEVAAIKAAPPGTSPVLEHVIDDFLSQLKVQAVRNSRLVTVAFESYRPELAAQVTNKLSQLYIQQTLDFRYQTSAEAAHWLGAQIEDQRRKVEAAELSIQRVKEKDGIVNIEERRTLLEQRLKELGTALTALKTTRLEREALYRQMRQTANPEELPEVIRSPVVENLRIELARLERVQAQLLQRYLENHPEVVRTQNQIKETRSKISAEAERVIRAAENDYKAAAAQEQSVSAALDQAKAEAIEISSRAVQYDSLKREIDAGKEVLNSLLARHKQTDVAQELRASNIRIVDPATVPASPIKPRKLRDSLLGVLLGISLGVGVALFLDYMDATLKTPEDVRVHLASPLLSMIPETPTPAGGSPLEGHVLIHVKKEGPFLEGYRLLRTALKYCWPKAENRIIVITSTVPGEGKSLTSINLALTLASVHGRVLLVDADMRKPQAHVGLGGRRSDGLAEVLVGKLTPMEAIQSVAGSKLSLMSAGGQVPSPPDLMEVERLRAILGELRANFDWVVIDSSPVGIVSDALILAPMTDGTIVVAGAEMAPRKAVAHTLERVAETGARVLGVVLNRVQVEKYPYYQGYYYGHYYGHRYGDRYYGGHGDAEPETSVADSQAKPEPGLRGRRTVVS